MYSKLFSKKSKNPVFIRAANFEHPTLSSLWTKTRSTLSQSRIERKPIQSIHSLHPLPDVNIIQHDEIRRAVLRQRCTIVRMLQYPRKNERDQVLRTATNQLRENSRSNAIGSRTTQTMRKANAATNRDKVDVQVVVHQIELLAWSKRTSGSINLAWPFRIGGIIRVFPHLTMHDEDVHFQ